MMFRNEFAFLSNFYHCQIIILINGNETVVNSVEHAYQALKTTDQKKRMEIALASTPANAKRLGKEVDVREGWDEHKVELMEKLVRRKFDDEFLALQLIATYPLDIVEENYWGDTFWGICKGIGKNHLGKILMKIRDELREEK